MTPEKRTQRLEALHRGNEIRIARSQLKRELATGAIRLSEVLRDDEDFVQTMQLRALLRACPGFGETKTKRAMAGIKASPSITLDRLPARRREELLAWITSSLPALKERV
jgi:hypothetical protein